MTVLEVEQAIEGALDAVSFTAHWDVVYAATVQRELKSRLPAALVEVFFLPGKLITEVRGLTLEPVRVVLDL